MNQRRLAAILAADVVGFSRLIGADEAATLGRLRALRSEVVDPLLAEHGGRVFKTTGDGLLAEFPSAVQALRCAIAIQERQRANSDALTLRIGLHSGDVVVEGDDLLGDGVNIAARIEPLAEPGGIALSARIREDAVGKLDLAFEDIGTPALKNITQPIQVFRIRPAAPERPALALPDKPSLVVLPFQNMSGDPEQEYFADGMVEDITTALSRIGGLFVIARNSAFTYKGKPIDVRAVGRELGVRYVVEGSVRKAGGRVRITAQLIEAGSATHLWADRFDGAVDDIFDLQDRVAAAIVQAVIPNLRAAEFSRSIRKPTISLDAYDHYLRAVAHFHDMSNAGYAATEAELQQALACDPAYARATALRGLILAFRIAKNTLADPASLHGELISLARSAIAQDPTDPDVLAIAGSIFGYALRDPQESIPLLRRAVSLNPNAASVLSRAGWGFYYADLAEEAIAFLEQALRIDPLDPNTPFTIAALGGSLILLDRHDEAIAALERAARLNPQFVSAWHMLAIAYAETGDQDRARAAVARLAGISPTHRIARWLRICPNTDRTRDRFERALRLAGLPE